MHPLEKKFTKRCIACGQVKPLKYMVLGGDAQPDGHWPLCITCKLQHDLAAKLEWLRKIGDIMKVWDGTSVTRPDALIRGAPDGVDWLVITKELQATQKFVANLAVNADAMPNLIDDIKARQKQLGLLQAEISKLTVPEDVMVQITKLNEDMKKLYSIYSHAGEVLQTVNFLQRQLLNLGSRIDEHTKETNRCRTSFENQVSNWQRINEKRWGDRLDQAEKQLGAIALALGIKKFGE